MRMSIQSANGTAPKSLSFDSDEGMMKRRLADAINEILESRKLKQREIALLLSIPQPKVSALKNFRLDQFSVEKLLALLVALNCDVSIMIRPQAGGTAGGQVSVVSAQ